MFACGDADAPKKTESEELGKAGAGPQGAGPSFNDK